jgi:hypothetical protein
MEEADCQFVAEFEGQGNRQGHVEVTGNHAVPRFQAFISREWLASDIDSELNRKR